jgi:hypothetical protein
MKTIVALLANVCLLPASPSSFACGGNEYAVAPANKVAENLTALVSK